MSSDAPQGIHLRSNLDQIGLARDFVAAIARAVPMSSREVYDLELVVDEALTNVIEHAYEGRPDRPVELSVTLEADALAISIVHDGLAFDPAGRPELDLKTHLAERRVGGLGLYLIDKLMDEVDYGFDAAGRPCISLVKRRTPPVQGGT
ncbi:MAG: ATP-binding protein [Candidatus Sericytochromatia bacterium]|nr:ATP-binding protein [Candidatus Sericytochromatia bacterium]